MADDLMTALRSLANRWALKARDFARASKDEGVTEAQASYDRGFAEGYYRAATELAEVIKEQEAPKPPPAKPAPTQHAPPPQQRPSAPPAAPVQRSAAPPAPTIQRPPAAPTLPSIPKAEVVTYAQITVGEALSVLEYAGCAARDVILNKDNTFRGIFSRWENMMPHDRIERIQKADNRIVILSTGKTETQDHFVDFAFKES